MRFKPFATLLVLFLASGAFSAWAEAPLSSDEMFLRARELSFDGNRQEGRDLCLRILDQSPGYTDVRIFLGRLHAWDKEYDTAREILGEVLEKEPENTEARSAFMDVEYWSRNYESSLRLAEEGLDHDSRNGDFLYGRARALEKLERYAEAASAAEGVLVVEPGHERAAGLLYRNWDKLPNKLSADYEVENFDSDFVSWQTFILQYRRSYGFGTLLWRTNLVSRFGDAGAQFEMDAYPGIGSKGYLYLNLGVSSSNIFPDVRFGAEYYRSLRRSWETSIGFRHLDFDSTNVTIYTGTIAKYFRNYWISLRPNYVRKTDGDSFSNQIELRMYTGGRYEYLGFTLSGGTSTEQDVITNLDSRMDSFRAKVDYQTRVGERLILKSTLGYRDREFRVDQSRQSYFVQVGFDVFF